MYKATDSSNKVYAIKKMILQSHEAELAAKKEIDMLRRFKHPNIIQLRDSCIYTENGVKIAYLLFPFVESNLRQLLDKKTVLSCQMILRGFKKVCEAANVLHRSNYVHNDIKPDNILIRDDGTPLLMDFGSVCPAVKVIVTRADSLRVAEDAALFCTLPYRAPELFDPPKGATMDTRTDVWSLGCLLFAWYYGYSPFECEFTDQGTTRLVDSSYSRVLSKIPRPKSVSQADDRVLSISEWILDANFLHRPYIQDVIQRVDSSIASMQGTDWKPDWGEHLDLDGGSIMV